MDVGFEFGNRRRWRGETVDTGEINSGDDGGGYGGIGVRWGKTVGF